jgi:hypothetical protein
MSAAYPENFPTRTLIRSFSKYVDWSNAQRVRLPNLKPSTTSISLRLPVTLS